MPSARADVIAGGQPSRPARTRSTVLAAVAGLLVGAVLGSLVTTWLRTDDPGPLRALATLGVPRESLGEVVVPVEVVNAGGGPLRVQDVQAAGPDGVTYALVDGAARVPPGALREPLVRVRRDCPAAGRLPVGDVRLAVQLAAGDDVVTEDVGVPVASARLLAILLECPEP